MLKETVMTCLMILPETGEAEEKHGILRKICNVLIGIKTGYFLHTGLWRYRYTSLLVERTKYILDTGLQQRRIVH
jgi:hypothetical protein